MILKDIEENDIRQIAEWNIELHEDEGSIPMSVDGAEARLRQWLLDDSFQVRIISVKDRAVGYLLYQRKPADEHIRGSVESVYIRQFYIVREARRHGHGRNAIKLLTQEIGGIRQIDLDVKTTNPRGREFWESLGFVAEHVAYTRVSQRD